MSAHKVGPFVFGWHLWAINRPRVMLGWADERECYASLSWGNGNSDPVWFVDLNLRLPAWLARRLP